MISSKGAIWPEFCKFWNQDIKSVKDKQKGSGKYSKVDYQVKTILRAMAISSGNHVVSKVQLKLS